MAVLQKIRGWGIWLSLIIAFALLLFLVDPTSISQFFGIGAYGQDPVGYVNKKKVTYADYVDVSNQYGIYKDLFDKNIPSDVLNDMINSSSWRSILYSRLLMPQMQEAGLYFTEEQIDEDFQTEGLPMVSGQYIQSFIAAAEEGNGNGFYAQLVALMREDAKNGLYARNYARLVAQTAYSNDALLERLVADYNNRATVSLITIDPSTEGVTVSDEEIRKEFNLRKYEYEPRTREVAYLDFHVYPSEEDMAAATENYNAQYENFMTVENVGRFLRSNSTEKVAKYYRQGELPAELDALVFGAGQDKTEILADKYDFTSARVLSSGVRSFSGVVNIYGFEDAQKADSLLTRLNAGEPVDSLIARHEVYAFPVRSINRNEASVEIGNSSLELDSIFDEKVGDYQLYQAAGEPFVCSLQSKDEPALLKQVAIYAVHVTPSSTTYNTILNQANEFVAQAATVEQFDELRSTLSTDIALFETTVYDGKKQYQTVEGSVNNAGRVTHDVFDMKVGTVSCEVAGTYDIFAVALKSAREEGAARLDEVKDQIREDLVIRNAANSRLAEVRSAIAGAVEMSTVAETLGEDAKEITLAYSGNDPRLIGAVSACEVGQIGSVAGADGKVYVFQVLDRSEDIHTDADALRLRNVSRNARMADDTYAQYGQEFNFIALPDALRLVIAENDVKDYLQQFFY